MNPRAEIHLSEEEIVWAIVDSSRLDAAKKEHLITCRHCLAERNRLANLLENAAQMAADGVPLSTLTPPFDDRRLQRSGRPRFGWRVALAGAALALMISFTVGRYLSVRPPTPLPNTSVAPVADSADTETWMTEVYELTESALPQVFLDIAGQAESGMNDEFIDFIVPTEENDHPLGEMSPSKGVAQC